MFSHGFRNRYIHSLSHNLRIVLDLVIVLEFISMTGILFWRGNNQIRPDSISQECARSELKWEAIKLQSVGRWALGHCQNQVFTCLTLQLILLWIFGHPVLKAKIELHRSAKLLLQKLPRIRQLNVPNFCQNDDIT